MTTSRRLQTAVILPVILGAFAGARGSQLPEPGLGLFEGHGDVGDVKIAGAVRAGAAVGSYEISGSGENIWGATDAFHFLWRRTRGDLTLKADVAFATSGGQPHRKAGWMIRASLDADAPYADAVVHGDGLIALQYRSLKGGPTMEIRAPAGASPSILLERHGDVVSMSVARADGRVQPIGSLVITLPDEVYAGLFVSAHDAGRLDTARFSNVALGNAALPAGVKRVVESTLETIAITTGERRVVYRAREHFEAPNWSRDGRFLAINRAGGLYRVGVTGGTPERIDTGSATRLNNDHGFSPDGRLLAISYSPERQSLIAVLPSSGGEPRLITPQGPSYWHGWSPDGRTLAYCAQRNGEYDVYTIPVEGGTERRLTTAPGLDDGPDYTADGRFIYFNSERTGAMRIWRMAPDGSAQAQVTFDEAYADWFPHPSPDGRWNVFLSFDRGVKGHPPNHDVVLRLMPLEGGAATVLARLFGGQGTINVPSWSPDSTQVAFVSYRLVIPG